MSVFGLDMGASGAVMCYVKSGSVDTILNEASKRKTPSLVSFYNEQRYIGEPAAALEGSNFKNTIRSIKRLVGRKFKEPDAQREISLMANAQRFSEGPKGEILVEVTHGEQPVKFDMTAVLAMYLGGLKATAERNLLENKGSVVQIRDSVLSVPVYFTDAQRRAVLDAARVAGLNVLRLINDSTAVALDYGMWKNARGAFDAERRTLMMFVDVGQSDTWVSITSFIKGKFTVLTTVWDANLGGRDIDAALADRFAGEFNAKNKALDPRKDAKAMIKLRNAAEKAKQVLTPEGVTKAEVSVEYLMSETDLRTTLKMEDLDAIVKPLADRLGALVGKALANANVSAADLAGVELIGGSSRMRQIKRAVSIALGASPDSLKPPNFGVLTTLNADESVARGCALMCAMASPQFRIATTFDVIEYVPFPVMVRWDPVSATSVLGGGGGGAASDDVMEVVPSAANNPASPSAAKKSTELQLFPLGTEYNKEKKITFKRANPFDVYAEYAPEAELPAGVSRRIATFKVSGPPPNTDGKIAVYFTMTKSGTLECSRAQHVTTMEEDVAPAPPAAATPPAAEGTAANGNGTAPPAGAAAGDVEMRGTGEASAAAAAAAPTKKIRTVVKDIAFTSAFVDALTPQELAAMEKSEQTLAAADRALREKADTRNRLEEFMYSARSEVEGSLKPFATEKEAEDLLNAVTKEEEWLNESGDGATTVQLNAHLNSLHKFYDKIQFRNLEIEARRVSSDKFRAEVQRLLQIVNGADPAHEHLSQEERAMVRDKCTEADNWLSAQQAKQEALKLNQDPVLWSSTIDEHLTKLRDACKPVVDKPKPKPPPSTTTPPPPPKSTESTPPPASEGSTTPKPADGDDVVKDDMNLD